MPVNIVFQSYHLMVAMFGIIFVLAILALVFTRKKKGAQGSDALPAITRMGWLQKLLLISPIFPFLAIQAGWITAEVGRQPYVVYPSTTGPDGVFMLTNDGISASVSAVEIIITLTLFAVVYLLLFVGWARVVIKFINDGPAPASAGGGFFRKGKGGNAANAAKDAEDAGCDASPAADEVMVVDVVEAEAVAVEGAPSATPADADAEGGAR